MTAGMLLFVILRDSEGSLCAPHLAAKENPLRMPPDPSLGAQDDSGVLVLCIQRNAKLPAPYCVIRQPRVTRGLRVEQVAPVQHNRMGQHLRLFLQSKLFESLNSQTITSASALTSV